MGDRRGRGERGGGGKGGCTRIERVSLERTSHKRRNFANETVKLALGQKHARVWLGLEDRWMDGWVVELGSRRSTY